jgi:hypothetical protein
MDKIMDSKKDADHNFSHNFPTLAPRVFEIYRIKRLKPFWIKKVKKPQAKYKWLDTVNVWGNDRRCVTLSNIRAFKNAPYTIKKV